MLPIIFATCTAMATDPAAAGPYLDGVEHPSSFIGHDIGARPARYASVIQSFEAIAASSPRAELHTYATSHEGRDLVYLIVSSPENLARLDTLRDDIATLSDPRLPVPRSEVERSLGETPAVAYLAYGIHGDELSSTDAALRVAYELAASESDDVRTILDNVVVLVDPVENPDGRERILGMLGSWTGAVDNPDPDGLSLNGFWPWGRGNHYLFDLNRDWFALVHPESRGRANILSSWHPQLVVDSHEMGSQDTYLFNPPRWPYNPNLPKDTLSLWKRFAADHAAAYDAQGWSYYTGDWNEEFFVGYGSAMPLYTGAMGLLYEQAGTGGGPVRQGHGEILTYEESVAHQFVSSMANLSTAATGREALLRHWRNAREEAIRRGKKGPALAYYFSPGDHPARAARLADRLTRLGLEVQRLERATDARLSSLGASGASTVRLPAGSYRVRLDQPDGLLARAILEPHTPMPDAFLAEQRSHLEREKGSRLYDTTAWSPLLAQDLEAWWGAKIDGALWTLIDGAEAPLGRLESGEPGYGWMWSGTPDGAVQLAAQLSTAGVRVRAGERPARHQGRVWPRGSFLIRRLDNPDLDVAALLSVHAPSAGVGVLPIQSALVDDGPDLGASAWRLLEAPKIAILAGPGLDFTSVGAAWHLLDEELHLRTSLVDGSQLTEGRLSRYNTVVLPNSWGSYDRILGAQGASALEGWVRDGGTLVALGGAASWASSDDAGLSAVRPRSAVLHDYPSPRFGLAPEAVARLGKMSGTGLNAEGAPIQFAPHTTPEQWSSDLEIPGRGSPVLGPGTWALVGQPDAESRHAFLETPVAEPLAPQAPSDDGDDSAVSRSDLDAQGVDRRLRRFKPSGTILRVELDPEMWLTWGSGTHVPVLARTGSALIAPASVEVGGRFAAPEDLHLGGLLWPEGAGRIAQTAFLTREGLGRGQVILFADDPNFRGQFDGTERLFMNAVLLGPGLGTQHTTPW